MHADNGDEHEAPRSEQWLKKNLRSIVVLAVTMLVCYLALSGVDSAQSAIGITFTSLVSFLFGERAALKSPGKDS